MGSEGSHQSRSGVGCPPRQHLEDYILGKLPEAAIQPLVDHVAGCPKCQEALGSLDGVSDQLIAAMRRTPAEGSSGEGRELERLVARAKPPYWASLQETEQARKPGPSDLLGELIDGKEVFLGQYQLRRKLGAGGMGIVFEGLDTEHKRVVAVKMLAPHRIHRAEALARFGREIEVLSNLNHPNIVQAHDAGKQSGQLFLVMELIDGMDFSRLVRHGGRLSIRNACEVIRQAAVGLQHAHDHGLVHRDVKPSNLMVTTDGTVKVLDLGLARLQWDGAAYTEKERPEKAFVDLGLQGLSTATGQAVGTFDYMAPEQKNSSRDADARADVYSLGCTLYFLLTGKHPITYRYHEWFLVHKEGIHPPSMADVIRNLRGDLPRELVSLLHRMTAEDPSERLSTAAEVAEALKRFTKGSNLAGILARRRRASRTPAQRYLDILGVDRYASPSEIQEAYLTLVRRYHPDHNPGDPQAERKFKKIQKAFEHFDPRTRNKKGAFHTALSAFLTVRVGSRHRGPSDEGLVGPLVAMATIIWLVFCGAFLLLAVSIDVGASSGPTTGLEAAEMDAEGLVCGFFTCFATLVYLIFVVAVLANRPDE